MRSCFPCRKGNPSAASRPTFTTSATKSPGACPQGRCSKSSLEPLFLLPRERLSDHRVQGQDHRRPRSQQHPGPDPGPRVAHPGGRRNLDLQWCGWGCQELPRRWAGFRNKASVCTTTCCSAPFCPATRACMYMLGWEHGGFSLDAAARIAGGDRAGLERLLRSCARPAFALERLTQVDAERVVYRLPKPQPDDRTALSLTPLELLDRLAALIPPPRRHRHRYHGVLAPHAPLRTSGNRPSPRASPRPADRRPGIICSNRCRTGTPSCNPHPSSGSISVSPGKHRQGSDSANTAAHAPDCADPPRPAAHRHAPPRRGLAGLPVPPPDPPTQPPTRLPGVLSAAKGPYRVSGG